MLFKKGKQHWLFGAFLAIFTICGVIYVSFASRNVVFSDYWRIISQLIPAVNDGSVSFATLWNAYLGQRNPFMYFLVLFNIKFTKLNCLWEEYAGIFVLAVTAILLYCYILKTLETENIKKALAQQIAAVCILVPVFNLNQWEILSLEYSFTFMLRILSYLVIYLLLENALNAKTSGARYYAPLVKIGAFSGVIVCLISQLYFPGMLAATFFIALFSLLYGDGSKNQKVLGYLCFLIPNLIAMLIYFSGLEGQQSGGNIQLFLEKIMNGDVIKAVLLMLSSSIVHGTRMSQISEAQELLIGALCLIIILYVVFLYFIMGMHKRSYLPVALIAYGFVSIFAITYGRINEYGLLGLGASRYVVETTLIWTGCFLVFAYALCRKSNLLNQIISACCICVVCISILNSDLTEMRMAPYRGNYMDELILILQKYPDGDISPEEATPFSAPADLVQQGIELMNEAHLNVYADDCYNLDVALEDCEGKDRVVSKNNIYIDFGCKKDSIFKNQFYRNKFPIC